MVPTVGSNVSDGSAVPFVVIASLKSTVTANVWAPASSSDTTIGLAVTAVTEGSAYRTITIPSPPSPPAPPPATAAAAGSVQSGVAAAHSAANTGARPRGPSSAFSIFH